MESVETRAWEISRGGHALAGAEEERIDKRRRPNGYRRTSERMGLCRAAPAQEVTRKVHTSSVRRRWDVGTRISAVRECVILPRRRRPAPEATGVDPARGQGAAEEREDAARWSGERRPGLRCSRL